MNAVLLCYGMLSDNDLFQFQRIVILKSGNLLWRPACGSGTVCPEGLFEEQVDIFAVEASLRRGCAGAAGPGAVGASSPVIVTTLEICRCQPSHGRTDLCHPLVPETAARFEGE